MVRAERVDDDFVVTSTKKVIPYEEVEEMLKAGGKAWVEGVKAQTAHQAAIRMSRRLGFKVVAVAARRRGRKGYVFMRNGDIKKV